MSDVGDVLSTGLPVYSVTKDVVSAVAKGCGMNDGDANRLGMAVGAGVSLGTALTTGCP